jgi:putative ubiquitin-RnfH superfamily antitoxin RatB of RatAB toxin-antitoxin module
MANVEVASASVIQVLVSYGAQARQVDTVALQLPAGATVADALRASGLLARHGLVLDEHLRVGVWMKVQPLDALLRDADRVEIYRPLKVDPKEARRLRYRRQGDRPPRGTPPPVAA